MTDDEFPPSLNEMAWDLVQQSIHAAEDLRIEPVEVDGGACVLDFGIEAPGSLAAGLALAFLLSLVLPADLGRMKVKPGPCQPGRFT